jgi:hypothetical protein
MCRRVTCPKCDRPTFAGCGAHVEQVLGDVPVEQRCRCRELDTKPADQKPGGDLVSRLRGLFRR